jgi:hypothetical protein
MILPTLTFREIRYRYSMYPRRIHYLLVATGGVNIVFPLVTSARLPPFLLTPASHRQCLCETLDLLTLPWRLKGCTLGEVSLSHPYWAEYNYTPYNENNDTVPLQYDETE